MPAPVLQVRPSPSVVVALGITLALAVPASHAAWPTDPITNVQLTTGPGPERAPLIVSDCGVPPGRIGALVAYTDYRNGTSSTDVYAQHVLAAGVVDPVWPANGRVVSNAGAAQQRTVAVSDGLGGAIAAWIDSRAGVCASCVPACRRARTGSRGTRATARAAPRRPGSTWRASKRPATRRSRGSC